MLNFWKFSQERRLVRCLRGGRLEPTCLEALRGLLAAQERREALPWGLLWKMHVRAEKALVQLAEDDPRHPLLREIRRGALWEVQSRELRGL